MLAATTGRMIGQKPADNESFRQVGGEAWPRERPRRSQLRPGWCYCARRDVRPHRDPSRCTLRRRFGVLGEGGQATTFEAVDKRAGRLVAIKRFRVRGAKSWKEVELAEREAQVLKELDHPALPRYVEHFEEGGELFLVTEKIEGVSLDQWKRDKRPFDEQDVLRFLAAASDVLDYLHRHAPPIIHRDLKPSNVIRRPDGSFAFIDFGAVRDRMKPRGEAPSSAPSVTWHRSNFREGPCRPRMSTPSAPPPCRC